MPLVPLDPRRIQFTPISDVCTYYRTAHLSGQSKNLKFRGKDSGCTMQDTGLSCVVFILHPVTCIVNRLNWTVPFR